MKIWAEVTKVLLTINEYDVEHKNNAPEHSMLQHSANLSIHDIQHYTQLRTDLQNYFMKTTTTRYKHKHTLR